MMVMVMMAMMMVVIRMMILFKIPVLYGDSQDHHNLNSPPESGILKYQVFKCISAKKLCFDHTTILFTPLFVFFYFLYFCWRSALTAPQDCLPLDLCLYLCSYIFCISAEDLCFDRATRFFTTWSMCLCLTIFCISAAEDICFDCATIFFPLSVFLFVFFYFLY